MAKDDYYVIVYKILAYLYDCLKQGKEPQPNMFAYDGALFHIHPQYWLYIIEHLLEDEYIEGLTITKTWGKEPIITNWDDLRITPKGIGYLLDNNLVEKAKKFLKDIKEITPFI